MTLKETLKQLKALGNEKMRAHNAKHGAGDNQFGVKHGDIRMLAKKIKTNHELALSLWETGNIDAQFLAMLLIKPKNLSAEEMDRMVRSVTFVQVADWLNSYVVKQHPDKETLRQEWMAADDRWAARAGWDLTAERVAKSPEGLDLPGAAGSHRVRNGRRRSRGAVDDEQHSCGNRHPLPQTPQAGHRHRREVGDLSGLSRFEGLHLALRPDLDQGNGGPAELRGKTFAGGLDPTSLPDTWKGSEEMIEALRRGRSG